MNERPTMEGVPPWLEDRLAEILWKREDVANYLGVSVRWVEQQVAARAIPHVPLPGKRLVRFQPEAIKEWAKQLSKQARGR
jgi:excisionase family DNA binding protein